MEVLPGSGFVGSAGSARSVQFCAWSLLHEYWFPCGLWSACVAGTEISEVKFRHPGLCFPINCPFANTVILLLWLLTAGWHRAFPNGK